MSCLGKRESQDEADLAGAAESPEGLELGRGRASILPSYRFSGRRGLTPRRFHSLSTRTRIGSVSPRALLK